MERTGRKTVWRSTCFPVPCWSGPGRPTSAGSVPSRRSRRCACGAAAPLSPWLSENLPSCRANVHICRACGREERRKGGFWELTPLTEWHAVRTGRLEGLARPGVPLLTAACPFTLLPEREVRGASLLWGAGRWWLPPPDPRLPEPPPEDAAFIRAFDRALTALPELRDLKTMAHFCKQAARPAGVPAAFDLCCRTDRLDLWLRLAVLPMEYRHVRIRCYSRANGAVPART